MAITYDKVCIGSGQPAGAAASQPGRAICPGCYKLLAAKVHPGDAVADHAHRDREAAELADGIERQLAALVERAAQGDENALTELGRLEKAVPSHLTLAVAGFVSGDQPGTWRQVAEALGMSRGGAQHRFTTRNVKTTRKPGAQPARLRF
jgi:hypothetical protein